MKITIEAETKQEQEGLKQPIIHEGVRECVLAGVKTEGDVTFAMGTYFARMGQLERVKLQLQTDFESQLGLEREMNKINCILQAQQNAGIVATLNGRSGLKLHP